MSTITPVDRVREKLTGVAPKAGGGWMAQCPAHEDNRPSLSLDPGDDGRALVFCHAGCNEPAIVAALGMTSRDLMPPKATTTKPRIVATYPYRDERGAHLYDVVRLEPKDFRQRRPDGQGGWIWSMKAQRRVPYQLDLLAGAPRVFVVEGEKDADNLRGAGVLATTNPGGAGKWTAALSGTLKAAGTTQVVILPDNDAAGQAHAKAVAQHCHAAGIEVRIVALPNLPPKADVSDWLARGGTRDQLDALAQVTPVWTPPPTTQTATATDDEDDDEATGSANVKVSQAKVLVDMALQDLELWHTPAGEPYASIQVHGHREHYRLRRAVRDYLARAYYLKHSRVAGTQALTDAANTLTGMALYDGPEHPVAVRLAGHESTLYLDLGTPDWQVVEITAGGWRLVADAPVRHWRPGSLRPLPVPVAGGSLATLRELWPNADDDTWTLIVSWLVATLQTKGPYPILVETGEQGSGKSTLGRMVRGLVDPGSPELRGVPRDERDVMIGALTSHVVALDNLSGLPAWLSDALCRIATGGGLATRTLYSDTDETLIDVARPILLTGIDSPATRGDLLDRSLVVHLPAMSDEARGDEAALWRRYHALRPRLVGALLDAAVQALQRRDQVSLPKAPRMKDACLWVTAAEPALGWPPGRTVAAWLGARADASADLLAGDVVAQAVLAVPVPWAGTATDLLTRLNELVTDRTRASRSWPTSPRSLSGHLKRLAPDLRRSGLAITDYREGNTGRRMLRIVTIVTTVTEPENTADSGDADGDANGDAHSLRHPSVTAGPFNFRLNSANSDAGDAGDGPEPTLSARDDEAPDGRF